MKFNVYQTLTTEVDVTEEFPIYRKKTQEVSDDGYRIECTRINEDRSSVEIWIDCTESGDYAGVNYQKTYNDDDLLSLNFMINKDNEYTCTKQEFDYAMNMLKLIIGKCE
jgi:hypothetical protein